MVQVEARKLIRQTLDNPEIKFGRSEATVRVNSVQSDLCSDDLEEILSAKNLPNALHLPKFESLDNLRWVICTLSTYYLLFHETILVF